MLVRLFTFFYFIFGISVAEAAPRAYCESLLSSSSKLSASAQSYINLIKHYIQESGGLPSSIVDKILNSKNFVNPFADRADTLSLQLSGAFKRIQPQVTQKNWQEIKKEIRTLVKKSKARAKDQEQKEEDTAEVFAPKIVDDVYNSGVTLTPAPAMQVVEGRAYVAALTLNEDVRLYEIVNGKLVLQKSENKIEGTTSPAWLYVNGRTFLATTAKQEEFTVIYVYELINGQLKKLALEKLYGFDGVQKLSWHTEGGRILLAGGALNGAIFVAELAGDNLNTVGVQHADNPVRTIPSWQTVNGRIFLAVGSDDFKIHFFEVEGNSFTRSGFIRATGSVRSKPVWHVSEGRVFVTAASDDTKMYLAELVGNNFQFVNTLNADRAVYTSAAVQIVNDEILGAYGSIDKKIYLYTLVNGELSLKHVQDVGDEVVATSSWLQVGEQLFLAVPVRNFGVKFFEWANDELVFKTTLKTKGVVRSEPLWYYDGKDHYAIMHVAEQNNLMLVKVINKMNKSTNKGAK